MTPLFSQAACSYRLESYWTYEICHGRFVKQYHEERDSKKIKKQEYFLGRWDLTMQNELSKQLINSETYKHTIRTKKIEGKDVPYFQLNYTDGTLCDLNEKPRQTNVLYMCFDHVRNEIYSIKEVSTCSYEAIIFTPLLCKHPLYRPKNAGEKDICCTPFSGTAKKPARLLAMEAESFKLRHEQFLDREQALKKVLAIFSVDKGDGQDEERLVRVQIRPLDLLTEIHLPDSEPQDIKKPKSVGVPPADISSFLSGENCLTGKQGYWKFEFCYGKHITQFHEDGQVKIKVKLGLFSLEDHKTWLKNNESKQPKKESNTVSHYYTKGNFCDEIKAQRETEVRFKCIHGTNTSPSSIILYLDEPKTCRYVLHVESPLICKLLPNMDEYGLFNNNVLNVNEITKDEL